MPPAGFEPAIPAGERLQTHALDRSATGIISFHYSIVKCYSAYNTVFSAVTRVSLTRIHYGVIDELVNAVSITRKFA